MKHTIKKNSTYFLTLTVVGWIDVFTRESHKEVIIESLRYCIENKGLNVYCYCLMSNHLHMIVSADEPHQLKYVIRDFKKFSAKRILKQIEEQPESRREWMLREFKQAGAKSSKHQKYKFWKVGSHAIELYNERFTWIKINYIHKNPVKDGYVTRAEHWKYSSARNYLGMDSVLDEVCLIPSMLSVVD
ncbi:MAG: transposase [Crocinitomicaceae bacterium]